MKKCCECGCNEDDCVDWYETENNKDICGDCYGIKE